MKNIILVLVSLLTCSTLYGQDFLGKRASDITHNTNKVAAVSIHASGDSLITVNNVCAQRFFEFRFDPITHLCIQENVRLRGTDKENLDIINLLIHSGRTNAIAIAEKESVYETKTKLVSISKSGDTVNISFIQKPSVQFSRPAKLQLEASAD